MSSPDSPEVLPAVARLLQRTEGLAVCYDPPPTPSTGGLFEPLPTTLLPELRADLQRLHPDGLFRHQRSAIDHILAGQHTVVATRTSSGKSLIYAVPVLNT